MKGRLCWAVVTTTTSPKQCRNVAVMGRGSTDETVVVVKLITNEDTVTYLRIKLSASNKEVGGEGWNM